MNILVVFKVENEIDSVTENEWNDIQDNRVDISYSRRILNCFDEAALETALCIADVFRRDEKPVHLTALTIIKKDEDISTFVKNLYAVHYDEVVKIICCEEDLAFQPRLSSGLIKAFIDNSERKYDAIMLGGQNSLSDSRELPLLLAEDLGLPCVSQVMDLTVEKHGLLVTSKVDSGIKHERLVTSAVFSFGNAVHAYLRISALREKMAARQRQCLELSPAHLGISDEQLATWRVPDLFHLYSLKQQKSCRFLNGENETQKADLLYTEYLSEMLKP